MAQDNVKPTRMELLNTKQKLVMAEKGHKLLKQKRDALVLAFFSTVKQAKDLRSQVDDQVVAAHRKLALAYSVHGDAFVESAALSTKPVGNVSVAEKNIMGVKIPAISTIDTTRSIVDRGYNPYASSARFDEAVTGFENSLTLIVRLAETENSLKKLLREIEKTNRRVNALEFVIQPNLKTTIKGIYFHLSRLESEMFFALKLTKKRLKDEEKLEQENPA